MRPDPRGLAIGGQDPRLYGGFVYVSKPNIISTV